jgi:putative acetyltransferase
MLNSLERIDHVHEADFDTLLEVWEASVRATHDFISEDNIKPLVSTRK